MQPRVARSVGTLMKKETASKKSRISSSSGQQGVKSAVSNAVVQVFN